MLKTKTGLLVEALQRKQALADVKSVELRGDFPQQNAFINDTARDLVAQCSRRAGKTNGMAIRFLNTMKRHPKSQCVYLALTRESAKEILWPVLLEMNETYELKCTFTESKLTMKHPNGATLVMYGADQKNFINRLKGRKYAGVGIDEAQNFGVHLQSLIDDVLTPATADYIDGWIAVTGTPGPVPAGYFFDITENRKFGYSFHAWTIVDNPYMPNPQDFLDGVKKKREWDELNPTYRREYLNLWVLDEKSLWIKYNPDVNHFIELPTGHKWEYVLGVDIGYRDADAVAVVAWSDTHPHTFLVEESIKAKQGISDLVKQIEALQKKYNAYKIVMDEGGLGKKIAEDIRQRFACPLEPADKAHKQDNVEFLNDAMRLGKFKAKSASRFAVDSRTIQIDWDKTTPTRTFLKGPHSDIIDAVLYAFRESYSYSYKKEKEKPKYGSKEWAEAQSGEMWEREMEGYQKAQEYDRYSRGED